MLSAPQWRALPQLRTLAAQPGKPTTRRPLPARSTCGEEATSAHQQNTAPAAAESSKQVLPPPASSGSASSAAASLPPERLKQLRRDGLALKDVIKMGRRGAADGLAKQVQQRWNTSEVRRLLSHSVRFRYRLAVTVREFDNLPRGLFLWQAFCKLNGFEGYARCHQDRLSGP